MFASEMGESEVSASLIQNQLLNTFERTDKTIEFHPMGCFDKLIMQFSLQRITNVHIISEIITPKHLTLFGRRVIHLILSVQYGNAFIFGTQICS